jgi:hypothetical protein
LNFVSQLLKDDEIYYLLKHKSNFSSTKAVQYSALQMDRSAFSGPVTEHRLDMPHLLCLGFIPAD